MLKDVFTHVPPGCAGLAETARNLQQVTTAKDIQKILGSADSTIRHRRARALMDRIEIYNNCPGFNQYRRPDIPLSGVFDSVGGVELAAAESATQQVLLSTTI